jgi:hypothetical protein
LSIKDEIELEILAMKAEARGIRVSRFYEPDLNNTLTAITLESSEDAKKLTSNLPLMLKELEINV